MTRPVFSKRFITSKGLRGSSAPVTVPLGHVYVVKQVTVYLNSLTSTITAFLEDELSGAALFEAQVGVGSGGWFGFYGAIVFEPGNGFHARVDAGVLEGGDISVSGYDLTEA